jgi:cysteine-rich repeat protein
VNIIEKERNMICLIQIIALSFAVFVSSQTCGIKEVYEDTFEDAEKSTTAYKAGTITTSFGIWNSINTRIAFSRNDRKRGLKSLRLLDNGKLSTVTAAPPAGCLRLNAANYGSTTGGALIVSYFHSDSWHQLGEVLYARTTSTSDMGKEFKITVPYGSYRYEIKTSAGKYVNIDNFRLEPSCACDTISDSSFAEDFESSTSIVDHESPTLETLATGSYVCNRLIVGTTSHDNVNGKKGLRLRNVADAVFEMAFDVADITSVTFAVAAYGNSGNSNFNVEHSCDSGVSWRIYADLFNVTVTSVTPTVVSGIASLSGDCRLRLKTTPTVSSSNDHFNVDDWTVTSRTENAGGGSVCGDGVLEGAEACDDGSTLNGDGCSSECIIESGYICVGEPSECNVVSVITTCNVSACDGVQNGAALRACLKDECHTGKHITRRYRAARVHMFNYVDNRNSTVTCVYGGYVHPFEYGGTTTPGNEAMNCEHTLPQSSFSRAYPMVSDLHHLFPTHKRLNLARSNYPYAELIENEGEVATWYIQSSVTTIDPVITEQASYSELSADKRWEPQEAHKGNVARALMYIFTMYEGNENMPKSMAPYIGETLAKAWHIADPVDSYELARNNAISLFQGTENPFVVDASLAARAFP